MVVAIDTEVKGLIETQRNLERAIADLQGPPILNAMRDSTLMVQRDAKINAPVDTGRLRASITPRVVSRDNVIMGIVGSNVKYAPYQELGTKPHWPPLAALEVWARRHGTTAYVVARAIARRGNVAIRFLQRAFEKNKPKIVARFERAVDVIVRRANRG